ncbi:MAG TPA: sigma-70 family RNA polymerase sigma factor [Pyrinomonadaceae bacterium]|nr:sigma-70 family RNA polymerase sigma factor [Pyrinomonadaceae bacterium]
MERKITAGEFESEALPHLDDLYRTAVRLVRDRSEAEDLVQEVYLQAWKSYHKYEPGTNCRAWLYKILFNKTNHHRRRKYSQGGLLQADGTLIAETVACEPPVRQDLTDEEVIEAVDGLPLNYREVVLLADVEEFSYREIAEVLGIPVGTVMSRLSRGRKQLRDSLAGVAREYGIKDAGREAKSAAAFEALTAA